MGKYTESGKAYYNEDGQQICGSQLPGKPVGRRCQKKVREGALRCHRHGDRAPRGIAHGHYTEGRYAKGPANLQGRLQVALQDPDYMSMRPELAMIDAMLQERWETLEDTGSDDLWFRMGEAFVVLKKAISMGDTVATRAAFTDIDKILSKGNREAAARQEIRGLIKDRQRIAESMQKAVIALKQIVTVEQTLGIMQKIILIVEGEVSSKKEVSRVMGKIIELAELPERSG